MLAPASTPNPANLGLETRTIGTSTPYRIAAHGMGGSIAATRPFLQGISGTTTYFHFPSHGNSPEATTWNYSARAAEVRSIADKHHAREALGISLGAGAILNLLAETPDRFDRIVLALPASLDQAHPLTHNHDALQKRQALIAALEAHDETAGLQLIQAEMPPWMAAHPAASTWAQLQWQAYCAPGMRAGLQTMLSEIAVPQPQQLSQVTAPVLVLAQTEDPIHPVSVAAAVAEALPNAQLVVIRGGLLWQGRTQMRNVMKKFLS